MGWGENGEFGHICVFEKNEFEVLDVLVGTQEAVWGMPEGGDVVSDGF